MVLDCRFWWVGGVCFEEGGVKNEQVVGLKSEKRSCFGRFSENKLIFNFTANLRKT